MNQINMAHTFMIFEQGIIRRQDASGILKALKELEVGGVDVMPIKLGTGGLYLAVESFVVKRTSSTIGGRMHTGRSRNDLFRTIHRMFVREKLNFISSEIIDLKKAFIKVAERNLDTVMPGYTHTQQAQPITLALWAMAINDAFSRVLDSFENAFKTVNLNPLGSAALAGTGFPINRKRTTELLGFNDIIENTLDAISSNDWIHSSLFALSLASSNISRIIEDLIFYHSWEFKFIELADEYTAGSSIMPQKKNPLLEIFRAQAGDVSGALISSLSAVQGLLTGFALDMWVPVKAFSDAVEKMEGMIRCVKGSVLTFKANKEIMRNKLTFGFSQATELADTLVREVDLPFRTAHAIVGLVVRNANKKGLRTTDVTKQMVDDASMAVIGKPTNLKEDDVRMAMDPLENVKRRKTRGGPAPKEVERMIADRKKKIKAEKEKVQKRINGLNTAKEKLSRLADTLIE
jgi:argininosuccinate lyase